MKRKGFTLVELLIVIAILLTVLSLGVASFNSFNRRETLKQAALTLKSNMRFSQAKAISAQKPASGCTTYLGMRMSFTSNTYSMQHECTPEGVIVTADCSSGSIRDCVILPAGVQISPVPSDFTFQTVTNTVNISADRSIVLTNGTLSYTLVVSPNGNIKDLGF